MKKTDIAMIVLVASVSVLISYFVISSLPVFQDASKPVVVKTTDQITDQITEPSEKVFNKDAINPTIEVIIGDDGQDTLPANVDSDE